MRLQSFVLLALSFLAAAAPPKPDANGKYHLTAKGIKVSFVAFGASLTNVFVKDSKGKERDITLGHDSVSSYYNPDLNPHYGGVPGRYANRIKNSTFQIDGKVYRTTANEGGNTLHGGPKGWDMRNWTVTSYTSESITFSLFDPSGEQGFPGDVLSTVTYSVTENNLHLRMNALSLTEKTPIMLTGHSYWNLDGFEEPQKDTLNNHNLWINRGEWVVDVDGALIPTGELNKIRRGSPLDFYSAAKPIGRDLKKQTCGDNCIGYDHCWISYRPSDPKQLAKSPIAALHSTKSKISLKVYSNQPAFQFYSCNQQKGTIPLKKTQGKKDGKEFVQKYGCVVMEPQDWIDGINHPEWGRTKQQIFGPRDPGYEFTARYEFGILGKK